MALDRDRLAHALLEDAPDAIVCADAQGVIRFWNQAASRIFGFPAEAALGQTLDIIVPETLRARHWSGFEKTMRTGESRYGGGDLLSVPAIRQDGSRLSVEFTIVPLHDESGAMEGIMAIMRDITPRFEELRALRRRVGELETARSAAGGQGRG
jgi:PAS domain S-box-containing protein